MAQAYLFTPGVREKLEKRILSRRRIFLFLDYDGTLVEMQKHPSLATLPQSLKRSLRILSGRRNITLGIITGRSLRDIQNLVGVRGIAYAGNHGIHISCGGKTWVHPTGKSLLPALNRIAAHLRSSLDSIPGVLVEHKRYTLSVHYRNVEPSKVSPVMNTVERVVRPLYARVALTRGKKILEVRPILRWDKGQALMYILKRSRAPDDSTILFLGDDVTDEDAFKVLPKGAYTIRVGKSATSSAKFYVRNPSQVRRLLEMICLLARH